MKEIKINAILHMSKVIKNLASCSADSGNQS